MELMAPCLNYGDEVRKCEKEKLLGIGSVNLYIRCSFYLGILAFIGQSERIHSSDREGRGFLLDIEIPTTS